MQSSPGPAPLLPVPMVIVAAILLSTPLWLSRVGLYQYLALEITIWMLFALGYNLLLSFTGLPSFGHGAYFGIGAYAFGLLQQRVWANLWFDLAGSLLATAALAGLVGLFISHRRGIYYALLTIAFGQVFWFLAMKWHGLTGGEDGLLNIKRPVADFGVASVNLASNEALFFFCLGVFCVVTLGLWRLVHSPLGRVLSAIKQNEVRAAFVGYNTWLYKWLAFVLSAALAGLAGALFAMAQHSAYPNVMSLNNSGFVVMMVLIGGGLVSFWGPLIGAAFFILARDLLGAYTETWLLWYGLAFVLLVLFKPEGVAGLWQDAVAKRRRKSGATAPTLPSAAATAAAAAAGPARNGAA